MLSLLFICIGCFLKKMFLRAKATQKSMKKARKMVQNVLFRLVTVGVT